MDLHVFSSAWLAFCPSNQSSNKSAMNLCFIAGEPGQVGKNFILRDGKEIPLPDKGSLELNAWDILVIDTPGVGGWGAVL